MLVKWCWSDPTEMTLMLSLKVALLTEMVAVQCNVINSNCSVSAKKLIAADSMCHLTGRGTVQYQDESDEDTSSTRVLTEQSLGSH